MYDVIIIIFLKPAKIIINAVDALQRLMHVCLCMQTNCIQLAWFSSCTQSSIVSRRSNKSTRSVWQISPELKGRYESGPTDCCQLCVPPIQGMNNDHQCCRLLCQGKGPSHWNTTENESVAVCQHHKEISSMLKWCDVNLLHAHLMWLSC